MLEPSEIDAHGRRLIVCPHCGGSGFFERLPVPGHPDVVTVRTKCSGCGHASADYFPSKRNVLRLVDEWAEGSPVPKIELPDDGSPNIVNLGVGVDSVAMLVAMVEQGVRPDLIIFSDVGEGGEKPETYAYLEFFDQWLQQQGFPAVTRVTYVPDTAPYISLEGNCLSNATLPSISFRGKGCSLKFKAEVIDKFLSGVSRGKNKRPGWAPAVEAIKNGLKPTRCIGYDFGPRDSCRGVMITENKDYRYLYPLRQLKLSREDCIIKIIRAGLPVPLKSACYYCGSSQVWEVEWLAAEHPDLLARALTIEDGARGGKHGLGNVTGLWGQDSKKRPGSWRRWCEEEGIIAPGTYTVLMPKAELLRRASAGKPPLESNLNFRLPLDHQGQLDQAA